MDIQLKELPLHALLAAAFVTYLPAHPEDVRAKVVKVGGASSPGGGAVGAWGPRLLACARLTSSRQ